MVVGGNGTRRGGGGICGSPLSSSPSEGEEEQEDVFTMPSSTAADSHSTQRREQAKRRRPAQPPKVPARKARKSASTSTAPGTMPRVGKKELVREAPETFVEYLARELEPEAQAQYCEEFGFGHGYLVRAPAASAWPDAARERRRFLEWIQRLGFMASSVHRHLYRISSLSVDVLLPELRRIARPRAASEKEVDAVPTESVSPTEAHEESKDAEQLISEETAERLQSAKDHFARLDRQELEMLSASEHDRMLSTIRHEQIADAMEDVLARPSVRKDRDRARRLSKLGRISERRLSLIPMRQSMIMPIMEEVAWEDEDDDVDLAGDEEGRDDDDNDPADSSAELELTTRATSDQAQLLTKALCPPLPAIAEHDDSEQQTETAGSVVDATSEDVLSITHGKTRRSSILPGRRNSVVPTRRRSFGGSNRRSSIGGSRRSSLGAAGGRLLEAKRAKAANRAVLRVLFHSGFLGLRDFQEAIFHVNEDWRTLAVPAYAWRLADYANALEQCRSMSDVYDHTPRGHYLSDGAYKEVFKVYSARQKRLEAVSVMDIRAIEDTGNQHIVQQEVAHSVLLSEIVRSGLCPHFVEIYEVFLAKERPDVSRWGNAQHRKPVDLITGSKLTVVPPSVSERNGEGLYQYIRMEFCDGGDVEDFIGLQDDKILPLKNVAIPFFFQMVFSVYCARERCLLRHCDIKLLNFFLKDISRRGLPCADDEALLLRYYFGDDVFDIQLPPTFSYWVKLADYGTADSNADNLGKPVTLDQFTTLENTPVEFLLEGDDAVQSFAADTFSLGLCLLHLFTGSGPYEEIMASVHCPQTLLQDLKRLWLSGKKNSRFTVLRRVVQDDPDDVLVHTLYRYLVLFGLPSVNPSDHKGIHSVWDILKKHLCPTETYAARASRRTAKPLAKTPREHFESDCSLFSLTKGSNSIISRARERIARISGAEALLLSLVAFNPADRPSMMQVLRNEVFQSLQSPRSGNIKPPHYVIDSYSSRKRGSNELPDV